MKGEGEGERGGIQADRAEAEMEKMIAGIAQKDRLNDR